MLNFKKPSRVIVAAAIALLLALSVGFAVNRAENHTAREQQALDAVNIYFAENMTTAEIVQTRYLAQDDNVWVSYSDTNGAWTKIAIIERFGSYCAVIALNDISEDSNAPEAPYAVTQTGVIPDDIDVPDAVLAAAVDWIEGDYGGSRDIGLSAQKELGAEFDNWRLDYIEHAYRYNDMSLEVYRFEWRVHTTTPDKIRLIGGMDLDAEGWLLDTYPRSWYLIFNDMDGELVYMFTMMENDCAVGDDTFTRDMLNALDALNASSSQPWLSSWTPLDELPVDYGVYGNHEQAAADNVYVNVQDAKIYNQNVVDSFYESVFTSGAAFMRTIEYTVEGDPIITDYRYDGEIFTVMTDTTRDNFGADEIYTVTYKYLVPLDRSRPQGVSLSYYLSNEQNIYTETGDGGVTLIEGLGRIPSPSE